MERREMMSYSIHPHGQKTRYCPSCGYTVEVEEYQKHRELDCPKCGDRLRAAETGEYRARPTIVGGLPSALDLEIAEHFNPGDRVELVLELPRELEASEVATVQQRLSDSGIQLIAPVEYGSTEEWEHALRLKFRRPAQMKGAAIGPLMVMAIIGALGAVGIFGIIGWRIGDIATGISEHILPITAMAIGGFLLYAYITKPEGA